MVLLPPLLPTSAKPLLFFGFVFFAAFAPFSPFPAACNLIDSFKQGSTVAFRDIDAAFFRLPASAFSEEGCSCCCDCKCCCGSLFCAHAFRGRILFSHFGCRLFFGNEIITAPVVYFGRLFFVCAFFLILPFSVLSCRVISSA